MERLVDTDTAKYHCLYEHFCQFCYQIQEEKIHFLINGGNVQRTNTDMRFSLLSALQVLDRCFVTPGLCSLSCSAFVF